MTFAAMSDRLNSTLGTRLAEAYTDRDRILLEHRFLPQNFHPVILVDSSDAVIDSDAGLSATVQTAFFSLWNRIISVRSRLVRTSP